MIQEKENKMKTFNYKQKAQAEVQSPTKSEGTVIIYYNPKQTINVSLKFYRDEIANLTIQELIEKSLNSIKQEYLLNVTVSKQLYCLYPAYKYGGRKQGYPEIDRKQKVAQTNIKRFSLQYIYRARSQISSEFNLERKYGFEKSAKSQYTCCQIFQTSKA